VESGRAEENRPGALTSAYSSSMGITAFGSIGCVAPTSVCATRNVRTCDWIAAVAR
jgi:hypothetical protein